MGFFDTLSGAVNYAAQNGSETFIRNYKERLRKASDSVVREKWDEVNSNYNIDDRIREVTEDEMRRRGLL